MTIFNRTAPGGLARCVAVVLAPDFDDCFAPHRERNGAGDEVYVLVDVFTETPLEGNQLAVFLTAYELAPSTMQAVAREMTLSETTFLLPPSDGGDARVRIFTPSMELPFAGHPVLGSAVVVAAATGKRDLLMETDAGPVPG